MRVAAMGVSERRRMAGSEWRTTGEAERRLIWALKSARRLST